jgi:hypothetical protein
VAHGSAEAKNPHPVTEFGCDGFQRCNNHVPGIVAATL